MAPSASTFKLYIFGNLGDSLVVFGEYQGARAVERLQLKKNKVASLINMIHELRGFIEAGFPTLEEARLKELGEELFDLIFVRRVRALLNRALGAERSTRPLELYAEDHQIAGWPWEFLYDSSSSAFICQELNPISRGIFSLSSPGPLPPLEGKVRILLLIGTLPTDPSATPAEEIRWIQEVFNSELATDAIEITVMQAVAPKELMAVLNSTQYDILHYFGHAGFDLTKEQGYLKLERHEGEAYKFLANDFARLLAGAKGKIRLVFLNGCETGRSARESDPARSAVAAAVLDRGTPAVIATQFSIPDTSAHYLSSMIYNGLVSGKSLMEAMLDGRRAMTFAEKSQFCDWGIPVLYTSDPTLVVFPSRIDKLEAARIGRSDEAAKGYDTLGQLARPASGTAPSVIVQRTATSPSRSAAKERVAIVDLDTKAGFLPDLVEAANGSQTYYHFEVTYLPLPSGVVRKDFPGGKQQLLVNSLHGYLENKPVEMGVNWVCCLTNCMIAVDLGRKKFALNLFAAELASDSQVFAISSYDMRRYSKLSGLPFANVVLRLCLSMLLAKDPRWNLTFHDETAGCLLDYCEDRDDILVGLRKTRFDHQECRNRVKDLHQLEAIDSLLEL